MTLREKIEVMEAFERGEEIEVSYVKQDKWSNISNPDWSWGVYNYRIKPNQTVTIEKWLFEDRFGIKVVQDIEKDCVLCYCHEFQTTKIKLLDTYEVKIS